MKNNFKVWTDAEWTIRLKIILKKYNRKQKINNIYEINRENQIKDR